MLIGARTSIFALALLGGMFSAVNHAAIFPRQHWYLEQDTFDQGSARPSVLTVRSSAPVAVTAGHSVLVELKFHVGNGYHVNSNKPRADYLIPTTLSLAAPAKLKIEKITYPAGADITLPFDSTDKLNVYSGEFAVAASLNASPTLTPGAYSVNGEIRYQACNDNSCFPPKKMPVQFEVVVSARSKHSSAR